MTISQFIPNQIYINQWDISYDIFEYSFATVSDAATSTSESTSYSNATRRATLAQIGKEGSGPVSGRYGITKSHFYHQPLISNVTNTTSWQFHCRKKCVRRQKTTDASLHHSNIDILSKIRKRRETSADITVVRKESGSSSILQTDIARWCIEMFYYSLPILRTTNHCFIPSNLFLRFLHLHSQERDIPRLEKGNNDVRGHQLVKIDSQGSRVSSRSASEDSYSDKGKTGPFGMWIKRF